MTFDHRFSLTRNSILCCKFSLFTTNPFTISIYRNKYKEAACRGHGSFGFCNMGISGYTYDIRTLKCKKFDGDCRYTNNGFRTLEECEAKCRSKDVFVNIRIVLLKRIKIDVNITYSI